MGYRIKRTNRSFLVLACAVAGAMALGAQQMNQAPYQGVSHPPSDDQIVTTQNPEPKPPAGHPYDDAQPAAPSYVPPPASSYDAPRGQPQANPTDSSRPYASPAAEDGTDGGIVRVAPRQDAQPGLNERPRDYAPDPDGDIVHVRPLRAGELGEGTMIRVRLLTRLSSALSEKGAPFRSRVASDVMQDGRVVIPAGAEITGRVSQVSSGHAGGYGTMRLEPEFVILPSGSRYQLHAMVTATPGSGAHVIGEGTIRPDSRLKRDGIEYGGAVGAGVIVGAVVAGPAGAATGGLIGAGAVTVHLLVSHPQATLESGTVIRLMLTDRLDLVPAGSTGN